MPITEEQKLAYIKERFKKRIEEIETLADMVTFVVNITSANVKTFLQNELQMTADETRANGNNQLTLADDLEALKNTL